MKTVASNDIRKDFTDIANRVKYTKESYIVTNQNKPSVGIVPVEFLQLVNLIKKEVAGNKKLAKLCKEYITFINEDDMDLLDELFHSKKINKNLKQAQESLKGKVRGF